MATHRHRDTLTSDIRAHCRTAQQGPRAVHDVADHPTSGSPRSAFCAATLVPSPPVVCPGRGRRPCRRHARAPGRRPGVGVAHRPRCRAEQEHHGLPQPRLRRGLRLRHLRLDGAGRGDPQRRADRRRGGSCRLDARGDRPGGQPRPGDRNARARGLLGRRDAGHPARRSDRGDRGDHPQRGHRRRHPLDRDPPTRGERGRRRPRGRQPCRRHRHPAVRAGLRRVPQRVRQVPRHSRRHRGRSGRGRRLRRPVPRALPRLPQQRRPDRGPAAAGAAHRGRPRDRHRPHRAPAAGVHARRRSRRRDRPGPGLRELPAGPAPATRPHPDPVAGRPRRRPADQRHRRVRRAGRRPRGRRPSPSRDRRAPCRRRWPTTARAAWRP